MSQRVLIVEDVASQLYVYTRVLKRAGYFVKGCDTAQRGYLELTQGGPYDIVLLDEHLPDLTGSKLLPLVRGVMEDETPPFVLMTGHSKSCTGRDGHSRPVDWEAFMEQGFADALAKPLNPRKLASLIESVLEGHHTTGTEVGASTEWIAAAQAWADLGDGDEQAEDAA